MICKRGYPALLPPAAYSNVSIISALHIYGVSTGDDKRVRKTWVRRPCIVLGSLRALRAFSTAYSPAGLPPACLGAVSALPELAGSEATVTTSGSSLPRLGDVRGNPKSIEI